MAAPTSQQDLDAKMNACMVDKGWDQIEQSDGSSSFETTDEQSDLLLEASSTCLELIGANLEPVKSDDEWRAIYESPVEVHECLNTQGLELPAPLSFQDVAGHGAKLGPLWRRAHLGDRGAAI